MTTKREKQEENSAAPDAAAGRFFALSAECANKSTPLQLFPFFEGNTGTTREKCDGLAIYLRSI
jgi:hypothetical protein